MSEIKTNIGSGLDGDYRKDLNGNFKIIKDELFDLKQQIDEVDTSDFITVSTLDKKLDGLTARINRIVLGTDSESIRIVVEQILKEEGVI